MSRADIFEASAVFVTASLMAWLVLQQSPGQLDPDAWYHMQVSREIAASLLWFDIPWLPYTVLGEAGPDHHWLWHLLWAPFASLFDAELALQLSVVAGFAMVPTGLCVFLRWQQVPAAGLWALLAVTAAVVVPGRFLMLRAQNLALLLVLASLWSLVTRQRIGSLVLGFVFMASYHGALILAPISALYLFLVRVKQGQWDWLTPAWMGAGVALGLLLTPWPIDNIEYLLFHTLFKTSVGDDGMAGTEWSMLSPIDLFTQAWFAHCLLLLGVLWGWRRESNQLFPSLILAVTLLFAFLFVGAWRFVEYYAPLAIVTAAVYLRSSPWSVWRRYALLFAALLMTAWPAWRLLERAPRFDSMLYATLGQYLSEHAEPGELVVNTHWPDFPMLLWSAPRQRWAIGLDASYLAYASPERFRFWWQLGAQNPGDAKAVINSVGTQFNSRWLAVNRAHQPLIALLDGSERARVVAESPQVLLFQLDLDLQ